MKKIRNIALFFAFALTNSCSTTEVETTIQTAIIDAEASFSTYTALMETCPMCMTNPVAYGSVLSIASVMGAFASSESGLVSNEPYSDG